MGDLQKVKRTSLRQNGGAGDERKFGGVAVILLVLAVALGVMGWQYRKKIDIKETRVVGAVMAEESAVVRLASVDTLSALYSIDPVMVADRVQRHPWIRKASVQRLPTGVMKIKIAERMPVMLVVASNGKASHYIDPECYQMPLASEHVYDVPIVSGALPKYHPVSRVENASACALARALVVQGRRLDDIISEFVIERDGNITLYTQPANGYSSLPVNLGHSELVERLDKLDAFWDQVINQPTRKVIRKIDLRFDSQIVTE